MSGSARHDSADVVIVGAGSGGAIPALVLAERGLKVVCLEQGPWFAPEDRPHYRTDWEWHRLTDWSTSPNVRAQAHDYPVESADESTLMWNGVGGGTGIYTATWPRLRPSDFRKGMEHGLAPDWPISYEDLSPYFETADCACGVGGWSGDPAMPPRGPFQTVPNAPGPFGPIAARGFDRLGWHWWPMPCAIVAEPYDGRSACNNCGNCQNGCPRGSLADMAVTHWPRALVAGAELRTGARAERVETDADGRATGVVYVDRHTGVRHFQPGAAVILAANGVGTSRLLLLSEGTRHPRGLANSSDQVGRNLMHHTLGIVECWVDAPTDSHKGIVSAVLICEEFAETDTSRGFVNGVTLHLCRLNGAGYQALGSHSGNVVPWGAEHHEWMARHFGHGLCVLIVGDDLPRPDNRVTLSETLTDSSGLPAPRISYGMCRNDSRLARFGIDRAVGFARAIGAFDIKVNPFRDATGRYAPPAWHLLGTARMGDDPSSSVVNRWHQAWDCPNLFITDGSVFATGGAVNPTSTLCALAYRAAHHLAENFETLRRADRPLAGAA
ncbi:MAG: GMC family oxidoreductase [Alphaproteobacteria bacterium]